MTPSAPADPTQPVRATRTRGPILAVVGGKPGLLYSCGHFHEGLPSVNAQETFRRVVDRLAPCSKCWPGGARFHAQTVALANMTPQVPK